MRKENSLQFVVIKLGTRVVVEDGRVALGRLAGVARQVRGLVESGMGVCLVVSGAVACGKAKMGGLGNQESLAAGVGQMVLSGELFGLFEREGLLLSQLLLTKQDLRYKTRRDYLRRVLESGAEAGVVFLLNENDVLDLHSFGGNDFLASAVAQLLGASHLLFLTDVAGVYREDRVLREVDCRDAKFCVSTEVGLSVKGVGGMVAKVAAASEAARGGIETFIASGYGRDTIGRIVLEGGHVGTRVV